MVMPYLNFDGNCEEAFRWYAEIFGGKIQHMAKYGDIPPGAGAPIDAALRDKVMHAQLMLTETGGISGADAVWPIAAGSAISIHAYLPNQAAAQRVFAALKQGGTVLGELAVNPPPDDGGISGSVQDRYGFTWILSAPLEEV